MPERCAEDPVVLDSLFPAPCGIFLRPELQDLGDFRQGIKGQELQRDFVLVVLLAVALEFSSQVVRGWGPQDVRRIRYKEVLRQVYRTQFFVSEKIVSHS